MGAGKYRSKITFQNAVITTNSYNEQITSWVDYVTVWAAVHTMGSKEFYHAQKMFSEVSVVFEVRYRTDITELHGIKFSGRAYEILGRPIDVENRHRELQIFAKEVV